MPICVWDEKRNRERTDERRCPRHSRAWSGKGVARNYVALHPRVGGRAYGLQSFSVLSNSFGSPEVSLKPLAASGLVQCTKFFGPVQNRRGQDATDRLFHRPKRVHARQLVPIQLRANLDQKGLKRIWTFLFLPQPSWSHFESLWCQRVNGRVYDATCSVCLTFINMSLW